MMRDKIIEVIDKRLRNPKDSEHLNGSSKEWQLDDSGSCIEFAGCGVIAEALGDVVLEVVEKEWKEGWWIVTAKKDYIKADSIEICQECKARALSGYPICPTCKGKGWVSE